MIRQYLLEYAPVVCAVIVCLYTIAKVLAMNKAGLKHSRAGIFFGSLIILSPQTIKNTFDDRLKLYYKSSNKINTWFYFFLSCVVLLYLFLSIIN